MSAEALVTLKLATSIDARIAMSSGESQWITSDESRKRAHKMRAEHDAVLVGVGTVLADDPLLTARLGGFQLAQPLRAVADSAARTPMDGQLVRSALAKSPVLVVAGDAPTEDMDAARRAKALQKAGVKVVRTAGARPTPEACVSAIAQTLDELNRKTGRDMRPRILLEGGGLLAASFLKAGLVDRIEWFRAPILIGGDGRPGVGALELGSLRSAPRFVLAATERIGDDVLDTYVRATEG